MRSKLQASFLSWVAVCRVDAFAPCSTRKRARDLTNLFQASSLEIDISNLSEDVDVSDLCDPENAITNGAANDSPCLLEDIITEDLLTLPRHSNPGVDEILVETENLMRSMHKHSKKFGNEEVKIDDQKLGAGHDAIFSNTYVDLGKVDTVGFDYDYTLVTYTEELLELIYEKALKRLVHDRHYPEEMLTAGLKFDPRFSIRGLAVDKETGWICHLSYTHKVAVAWEGREKVLTSRIYKEYRGKRALTPAQRKSRLKPLNDLFSMAECCLIADTIQFFKDNNIDFCPNNAVNDILASIGDTHITGEMHRIVAADPGKYFNPSPHLKNVLSGLKNSGKHLMFASNSPYWYVDAGMKYALGDDWMKMWDTVIVSAGKPAFYTEQRRPFREVNKETNRVKFKKVEGLVPGEVYTGGCIKELTRLMRWSDETGKDRVLNDNLDQGAVDLAGANVLYIGDSLFADLVDAKREYGWKTAAVFPEVGFETDIQQKSDYILVERTIGFLLNALRLLQEELGPSQRTEEDLEVLDTLERLVSSWRDRETALLGNPFGSVFRARYQPSLFAHSLRRYCDMYMSNIGSLRLYSPQHRFYPEQDFRLLAHEINGDETECWDLSDVLKEDTE